VPQPGTEFGLPDSVFDVGTPAESILDGDQLGAVAGAQVGDDEADRVGAVRLAGESERELVAAMVRRRRDRPSALMSSASMRALRTMV